MDPSSELPDATSLERRSVTRRSLLGGSAALAALAISGCSSSDDDDDGSANASTTSSRSLDTSYRLGASFPVAEPFVLAGVPARMPFIIAAGDGAPLDEISSSVVFTVLRDGEPVGDPVEVEPRSKGLDRAFLPLLFTFPDAGVYEVNAVYEDEVLVATLQAFAPEEGTTPGIGAALPVVDTPTTDDNRGVSPICTDKPPCSLHELNLADVLANGQPTALLISTPAFCQTVVCGPVLGLFVDAMGTFPGVDFIHAEVYTNPEEVPSILEAAPAPVVEAMGLTYEPALFVTDGAGVITARLDLIFDGDELDTALRSALPEG